MVAHSLESLNFLLRDQLGSGISAQVPVDRKQKLFVLSKTETVDEMKKYKVLALKRNMIYLLANNLLHNLHLLRKRVIVEIRFFYIVSAILRDPNKTIKLRSDTLVATNTSIDHNL